MANQNYYSCYSCRPGCADRANHVDRVGQTDYYYLPYSALLHEHTVHYTQHFMVYTLGVLVFALYVARGFLMLRSTC